MPGVSSQEPFELGASLEWRGEQRGEGNPPGKGEEQQTAGREASFASLDRAMLQLCWRNQYTRMLLLCGQCF